jgi:5-methylcytosine-specific restriction endonuclease McrA
MLAAHFPTLVYINTEEGKIAALTQTKKTQATLCCPCGNPKVLARGLCPTCYTLKRQDEAYFGGLREEVLKRDKYRCRACGAPGHSKRSIVVHHRAPGISEMDKMISLCPACHAKVERTQVVLSEMDPLLLALWREKHPDGQEQIMLNFA